MLIEGHDVEGSLMQCVGINLFIMGACLMFMKKRMRG